MKKKKSNNVSSYRFPQELTFFGGETVDVWVECRWKMDGGKENKEVENLKEERKQEKAARFRGMPRV